MATTFLADCPVSPGYNEDSAKYIKEHWNITLRVNTEEDEKERIYVTNVLSISVRDYPQVMSKLEETGYLGEPRQTWQINRISEQGVTLYLTNSSGMSEDGSRHLYEEAFIFIPTSNIIAIHNITEQFFINEAVRSMECTEKPRPKPKN